MISKVLQWLGSHHTAAQPETASSPAPATQPRARAWSVVITLNRWDGVEQYKTPATKDLVEALRLANQFTGSVLYANLVPAQFAKHLPPLPGVIHATAVPGPLSWIEVLHRRQCVN